MIIGPSILSVRLASVSSILQTDRAVCRCYDFRGNLNGIALRKAAVSNIVYFKYTAAPAPL